MNGGDIRWVLCCVVEGTVWDALDVSVDTSNLLELFSNDKMSGKYQVDAGHHSNTGDTSVSFSLDLIPH